MAPDLSPPQRNPRTMSSTRNIWAECGDWRANFHIDRIRAFEASAQPWTLCVNLRTLHARIAVLAPALFGTLP